MGAAKTIGRVVLAALVGALVWAAVAGLVPWRGAMPVAAQDAPDAACDPARSVLVSGTAVINVGPDRALIRVGVQSNATTVAAVEKTNSDAITRVTRALVAAGVQARDVSTDRYVVEPVYDDYDSLIISGYRISNEVAVTVRDVAETSALVSTALESGANQVHSVEFYTSELRRYRDEAREMAVTAAREKADALALAAGARAGCVLSITENSWSSYSGSWYSRSRDLWTQNVAQNVPSGEAAGVAEEPISLGLISVQAEVALAFALE